MTPRRLHSRFVCTLSSLLYVMTSQQHQLLSYLLRNVGGRVNPLPPATTAAGRLIDFSQLHGEPGVSYRPRLESDILWLKPLLSGKNLHNVALNAWFDGGVKCATVCNVENTTLCHHGVMSAVHKILPSSVFQL